MADCNLGADDARPPCPYVGDMSHRVTYNLPQQVRGARGSSPIVASDVVTDSARVRRGNVSLGRILRWGLMVLSLSLFVRMAVTNHSEISGAIGHLFTRSGWLVAAACC